MNKQNRSASGVFLMELIVVIFFFILCSSICILAFAKADRMSRFAADRNRAVLAAQSVAEAWKLEGEDGLLRHMDAKQITETKRQEAGHYQIRQQELLCDVIVEAENSGMKHAKISVSRISDAETLFDLIAVRYERPRAEGMVE